MKAQSVPDSCRAKPVIKASLIGESGRSDIAGPFHHRTAVWHVNVPSLTSAQCMGVGAPIFDKQDILG
jgi:hypothetical protein